MSSLPHVREMCLIEMIARSAKKLLRKELAQLIYTKAQEHKQMRAHGAFKLPKEEEGS